MRISCLGPERGKQDVFSIGLKLYFLTLLLGNAMNLKSESESRHFKNHPMITRMIIKVLTSTYKVLTKTYKCSVNLKVSSKY